MGCDNPSRIQKISMLHFNALDIGLVECFAYRVLYRVYIAVFEINLKYFFVNYMHMLQIVVRIKKEVVMY